MNNNYLQLVNKELVNDNRNYEDNHNDEDNNEQDNENEIFNDDNIEFINFKKYVKEWLALDDDILTLNNAIKDRKNKKTELTKTILDFMDTFKINDLNTSNGKIKFTKSLYTKPLNKKYLISRLGDFFKDYNKGEKVASFILDNRDKEEKFRLRRVINKKEMNI